MKFDPTYNPSRTRLGFGALLMSTALFAITRGAGQPAGGASAAEEPEVEEDAAPDETSQAGEGSTGTGTGTGTAAAAKTTNKTVEEATANVELVVKVKAYDEAKAQAASYMCDIAEFINTNNLGRPVVIKTLMEARGLTLESAASNASRLMKLAKNPDLIKALRDGTATIRETVYGKAKSSNAKAGSEGADGAAAGGTPKKTDAEKKEDRYNRQLGEFVKTAKECGYSQKDILTGFTAALKDAGVK